jgi:cystathionine beta-lyase/cystathionine gamma-synthase
LYQQPAKFGVDIVIHTLTKYINGHSDVMGGVVCASHDIIRKLFINEYMTLGGIMSPHDASLVIRGLRTLPARMKQISESTAYIIEKLKGHPRIKSILYPFDPEFPQYELAKKQMSGCGGLYTIEFDYPDIESMLAMLDKIKRWKIAASWGGHEALMMPIAAFYNLPGRDDPHLPWNYVRFYVGLEEAEYLLEDLLKAIN